MSHAATCLLLVFSVCLAPKLPDAPPTPEDRRLGELLGEWEKAHQRLKSFRCTMTLRNVPEDAPELKAERAIFSGKLEVVRPSHFRFDKRDPKTDETVTVLRTPRAYYSAEPGAEKPTEVILPEKGEGDNDMALDLALDRWAHLLLLDFRADRAKERFEFRLIDETEASVVIGAKPRQPKDGDYMREARLVIDGKTKLVRSVKLTLLQDKKAIAGIVFSLENMQPDPDGLTLGTLFGGLPPSFHELPEIKKALKQEQPKKE
jgi:hypothetical protein